MMAIIVFPSIAIVVAAFSILVWLRVDLDQDA
jgi:hypothetical protein